MGFHSKVGLALSGGGMRGMAHIGLIQAMREYNVEADIVSGTSIGAIVGAMYAADISTKDMLQFFRNITIFNFRNYAFRKPGLIDAERFRPALLELFPHDSFDHLQRELYISISDMLAGKNRLIESGSLITALMCSAAIPGVFTPIRVGKTIYADGGITNNFPVEPLSARCNLIIGSYVNPLLHLDEDASFKNAFALFDRALVISTFRMESPSFHIADIFVMPKKINRMSPLSLKNIDECYKYGYEEAVRQLDAYFERKEKA